MSTPSNTSSSFPPTLEVHRKVGNRFFFFSLFQRLVGAATVRGGPAARGIWTAQAERWIPEIKPQLRRLQVDPGRQGWVPRELSGEPARVEACSGRREGRVSGPSLETAQALARGFGLKSQVQVPPQAALARSCLFPTQTSCFFRHK